MYKIGIIGTSLIAQKFVNACSLVDGIEASVVYSRSEQSAQRFKQVTGIKSSLTNINQLVKRPDVDVIYIASPNQIHYEQVVMAIKHYKHVIVEKPITLNEQATKELYVLADKYNVLLIEAVKTLAMNTYQALKTNLALIGNPESFEFNMLREYENYPKTDDDLRANIYRQELGGGVINDLGSYAFYPLLDLLPNLFTLSVNKFQEKYLDIETEVAIQAKSEKISGSINLSMCRNGENISYIRGELGLVTIDSLSQFNQIIFYDNNDNLIKEIKTNSQHLMQAEITHLRNCLDQKQKESEIFNRQLAILVQTNLDCLRNL